MNDDIDRETVRCDGCAEEVIPLAAHENIQREEFDTLCYTCTKHVLALCRLDNINLPALQ